MADRPKISIELDVAGGSASNGVSAQNIRIALSEIIDNINNKTDILALKFKADKGSLDVIKTQLRDLVKDLPIDFDSGNLVQNITNASNKAKKSIKPFNIPINITNDEVMNKKYASIEEKLRAFVQVQSKLEGYDLSTVSVNTGKDGEQLEATVKLYNDATKSAAVYKYGLRELADVEDDLKSETDEAKEASLEFIQTGYRVTTDVKKLTAEFNKQIEATDKLTISRKKLVGESLNKADSLSAKFMNPDSNNYIQPQNDIPNANGETLSGLISEIRKKAEDLNAMDITLISKSNLEEAKNDIAFLESKAKIVGGVLVDAQYTGNQLAKRTTVTHLNNAKSGAEVLGIKYGDVEDLNDAIVRMQRHIRVALEIKSPAKQTEVWKMIRDEITSVNGQIDVYEAKRKGTTNSKESYKSIKEMYGAQHVALNKLSDTDQKDTSTQFIYLKRISDLEIAINEEKARGLLTEKQKLAILEQEENINNRLSGKASSKRFKENEALDKSTQKDSFNDLQKLLNTKNSSALKLAKSSSEDETQHLVLVRQSIDAENAYNEAFKKTNLTLNQKNAILATNAKHEADLSLARAKNTDTSKSKYNKEYESQLKDIEKVILAKRELDSKSKGGVYDSLRLGNTAEAREYLGLVDRLSLVIEKLYSSGNLDSNGVLELNPTTIPQLKEAVALVDKVNVSGKVAAGARKESTALDRTGNSWLKLSNKASDYYAKIQKIVARNPQMERELQDIIPKLKDGSFDSVTQGSLEFQKLQARIKAAGLETETFGQKLKRAFAEKAGYGGVAMALGSLRTVIRAVYSNVVEVDTAMTSLKKVTEETDYTYARFLDNASSRAQKLGASLSNVITSTAEFARLGYTLSESTGLSDAASVYFNVGDGLKDVSDASQSIISTMKAFGIEAEHSMKIVDEFNEVGNNYAISSSGIGVALQTSAAALAEANNTMEQSIGMAVGMNAVTQNPERVGTTLKTMSMYLRAAKEDAEAAGESTDGMASSVSELRSEILKLTNNKVDIMLGDNKTFKATYDIMKELSFVWKDLADVDTANILEMIGGKRNASTVSSLLNNFDDAEAAMKTAGNSSGSALKENETYLDSISGKMAQLGATFEALSTNIINSEWVKAFADVANQILQGANALSEMNLLLPTAIAGFLSIKGAMSLSSGVSSIATVLSEISTTGISSVSDLAVSFSGLSKSQQIATMSAMGYDKVKKAEILSNIQQLATGELVTESKLRGMLASTSLNLADHDSVITKLELSTANGVYAATSRAELIAKIQNLEVTTAFTATQKAELVAKLASSGANVASASTWSLLTKAIWGNIAATATWLVTNPVGWLILAASAVTAAVLAYNGLTTSTEEHREKLGALKEEYRSTVTDLDDLNSELEKSSERMDELLGKGKLSFVEQNELNNLQVANESLERQIELLEAKKALEQVGVNKKFVETMDSDLKDDTLEYFYSTTDDYGNETGNERSEEEYIQTQIDQLKDSENAVNIARDALTTAQINAKNATSDEEKRIANRVLKDTQWDYDLAEANYTEIETYLHNKTAEFKETTEGIDYIPNPKGEDDEAVNAWLDYVNQFYSKFSMAIGNSGALTDAFSRVIGNGMHTGIVNSLQNMSKEGDLTSEYLASEINSNSGLKAFAQDLKDNGIIKDFSKNSLQLIIDAFALVEESADNASEAIADVTLESMTTNLKDVQENFTSMREAYEEFIDKGAASADTLSEIQKNLSAIDVGGKEVGVDKTVLDEYVKTLGDSSSTADEVKEATKNLATAYLATEGVLEDLNDENLNLVISQLKLMGVTNASEVATKALAMKKLDAAVASAGLSDATWDSVEAFLVEAKYCAAGSKVLEDYRLTKAAGQIASFNFNTASQSSIASLIAEAEAAGVATASISALNAVKTFNATVGTALLYMSADDYNAKIRELTKTAIDGVKAQIGSIKIDVPNLGGAVAPKKSGGSKETELYLAEIDKLYNAAQRLKEIQEEISRIDTLSGATEDTKKLIEYQKQLLELYEEEQKQLNSMNNTRDSMITTNVNKLKSQGFKIDYDHETNELYINNMEQINKLQGSSIEKTNEVRKAAEKLIDDTVKLNDANKTSSSNWMELANSIKEANKQIYELSNQSYEEYIEFHDKFGWGFDSNSSGAMYFQNEVDVIKLELILLDQMKDKLEESYYLKQKLLLQERQYDAELNKQNSTIDAVLKVIEKEKDALDKQREILEGRKSDYETTVATVSSLIDEQIDALQSENDKLEKQVQLQKALEALELAKTQRTKRIFKEGEGFVWEADREAIDQAQSSYDDLLRNNDLESEIEALEEYKLAWQNTVDVYQKGIDSQIAASTLGANWENDILLMRADHLGVFSNEYADICEQLNEDNTNSVVSQINNLENLSDTWGSTVENIELVIKGYAGDLTTIAEFEKSNYDQRTALLEDFTATSIKNLEILRKATSDASDASSKNRTTDESIARMKANSAEWSKPNSNKQALADESLAIGTSMNWTRDSNGVWWKPDNTRAFKDGGIVDYTGMAEVHGGTGYGAEVVFNNSDVAKLYDYVHTTPSLVQDFVNSMMKNNATDKVETGGGIVQPPISISIGDIILSGVQDVDALAQSIRNQLPAKVLQQIYSRK